MTTIHRLMLGTAGLSAAVTVRRWMSEGSYSLRGKRTRAKKGHESTSGWAPSMLTTLTGEAAERTNQLP